MKEHCGMLLQNYRIKYVSFMLSVCVMDVKYREIG